MNQLIKIESTNGKETVNARDLHDFLESKRHFANWIKNKIAKYDFKEGVDFAINKTVNSFSDKPIIEYHITIEMAKELSMVENNGKGKMARLYFLEVEKKYKQNIIPESFNDKMLDRMMSLLERMDDRLTKLESLPQQKQLPFVPEIDYRSQINKIVKEYSARTEIHFSSVWNSIYSEMYYVFHKNYRISADNRNMKVLDYIESEGMIEKMLVVTKRVCE